MQRHVFTEAGSREVPQGRRQLANFYPLQEQQRSCPKLLPNCRLCPFSEREQLLTDPPSPLIYLILSPEIEVLEDHSTNNSDENNGQRIAVGCLL